MKHLLIATIFLIPALVNGRPEDTEPELVTPEQLAAMSSLYPTFPTFAQVREAVDEKVEHGQEVYKQVVDQVETSLAEVADSSILDQIRTGVVTYIVPYGLGFALIFGLAYAVFGAITMAYNAKAALLGMGYDFMRTMATTDLAESGHEVAEAAERMLTNVVYNAIDTLSQLNERKRR